MQKICAFFVQIIQFFQFELKGRAKRCCVIPLQLYQICICYNGDGLNIYNNPGIAREAKELCGVLEKEEQTKASDGGRSKTGKLHKHRTKALREGVTWKKFFNVKQMSH